VTISILLLSKLKCKISRGCFRWSRHLLSCHYHVPTLLDGFRLLLMWAY
jgi:hypothetical protein